MSGPKMIPYLASPQATRAVLDKYDFALRKKYGQNFLVDARVLETIVREAGITEDDFVLEIGPGIGTMTQYLAAAAREVTTVEVDKMLIPILEDTLKSFDNVSVIHADILKVDIAEIAQKKNDGKPIKVVANLPYYITTPIIMQLLESRAPIESITVMVQTEVAERMQTGPGTKDYGALSLAVQYYTVPEIVAHVPPHCFLPKPKVSSSVVRLTCRTVPAVEVKDEKLLFALIRASFNQRRKTLINGLLNAQDLSFTRLQLEEALMEMGKPAAVRGEALTLEEFAQLSNLLSGEKLEALLTGKS